jgi:predicted ABC-type transport system involved in lysophospholipase L1 biosynthesis ATPase subunit
VGYAHRRSHSQPQLTAGEQQRGQVAGADEQLERSQQES